MSGLRDRAPLLDSCTVVCCGCVCSAATGRDCCDCPDTAMFDFFPPETGPTRLFFEGEVFTSVRTKKQSLMCQHFNAVVANVPM